MQIKTIYINKSNFDFANLDSFESRQIMIIYIFTLCIFEH